MGLVQGRRMENRFHAFHASFDIRAVGYRSDLARKWRLYSIESNHLVARALQHAHQCFAQMSRTTCN